MIMKTNSGKCQSQYLSASRGSKVLVQQNYHSIELLIYLNIYNIIIDVEHMPMMFFMKLHHSLSCHCTYARMDEKWMDYE